MKNKICILFLLFVGLFIFSACGGEEECIHTYTSEVVPATCIEDGYTIYICSLCEDTYKTDIVRAEGHLVQVTKEGYAATCTESGLTNEETCIKCNTITKQQLKISILGHKYGEWLEITKPTSESTGLLRKVCQTDNSHVEEVILPVLMSNSSEYTFSVNAATCTSEGLETYLYNIDGQVFIYTKVLAKLPHTYQSVVTEATCVLGGYTTHTCSCSDSYIDSYVDALGHKYIADVTEPTCVSKGYTVHTCHCGDTYTDTYTDEIPHDYVEEVVEATCTAEGYTSYTCVCGDNYKENYTNKIPHKYNSVTVDPTCTEKGYVNHVCECGDNFQDTYVNEIGHDYSAWELVTAPTANSNGKISKTCLNDSTHIVEYTLNKLNETDYQVDKEEALCEEDGLYTYRLTHEGQLFEFEIVVLKTGHIYNSDVTEPTCLAQGYTTYTCKCGLSYVDDYVDALGHDIVVEIAQTNPTCTKEGFSEKQGCSRCDLTVQEQTVIEALGHYCDDNDGFCDRCGVIYGDDIIYISTYEDLLKVNDDLDGRYQLAANIDITGKGFVGFGSATDPFTGYFYGNGYSIKGYEFNGTKGGLFYTNYGTIHSLILENISLSSTNSNSIIGGLTCYNYGTIDNCEIKGKLTFKTIMTYKETTDYPSYDAGDYAHTVKFGGFAAENYKEIKNSKFTGNCTGNYSNTCTYELKHSILFYSYNGEDMQTSLTITSGLIAGLNSGSIDNCEVGGKVINQFYLTAKLTKTYGLAIANIKANVGTFVGENKGIISDSSAVVSTNSEFKDNTEIKDSLVHQYGGKCNMTYVNAKNYESLVAINSGTINGLGLK